MLTAAVVADKRRTRLWRLAVTSMLMAVSLAIGVAITAYIALLLLLPIATMVGMAAASAHATTSALYTGDSVTRMTVLTQLRQTIDAQPNLTFDVQAAALFRPAIEICISDSDPDVAALAEGLADDIECRTTQTPQ